MHIEIATPSLPGTRSGNQVTAERWASVLRDLGHRVEVVDEYSGAACDLLIALHAKKSAPSVARISREQPSIPIVVGLAGTDLYGELDSKPAQRSLELATRLVLLQPVGLDQLSEPCRAKARVIYQSAPAAAVASDLPGFPVCVVGNLRDVKDPFRCAEASRLLPETSRIQILHAGAALGDEMRNRAEAEARQNPRYQWLGELAHDRTLELIAGSRLLVHSSRSEGGANVLSEALAASVPILSSRIPGSVGILGPGYPGFFAVGDTAALADLLQRAESDGAFYGDLGRECRRLASLVDPARERKSWAELLAEL